MDDGRRHETGTLICMQELEEKAQPLSGLTEVIVAKVLKSGLQLPTKHDEILQLVNSPQYKPPAKESDRAKMYIENQAQKK